MAPKGGQIQRRHAENLKPGAPFRVSLSDPTLLFAIVCGVFPALKARDPMVIVEYATDPACIAALVMTVAVFLWAKSGTQQATLQPWQNRAAMW